MLADALTAFTTPGHEPYRQQPGAGLAEVFGLDALGFEMAFDGWTEIMRPDREQYFDRIQTVRYQPEQTKPILTAEGRPTPLVAVKFIQPVQPTRARPTHRDAAGRVIGTVNEFGKGHALWMGTLLGMSCREATTPAARYQAVADLIRPYIPKAPWKLDASKGQISLRRLTSPEGDLYVLINEHRGEAAPFKLSFDRPAQAREMLFPDRPAWKKTTDQAVEGILEPLGTAVIFRPKA